LYTKCVPRQPRRGAEGATWEKVFHGSGTEVPPDFRFTELHAPPLLACAL
jgi:hypothetical protein